VEKQLFALGFINVHQELHMFTV